jgi:AmiR/NasT family two-component response regulator
VAVLQEHPPTLATVVSPLRSALTGRVIVEQAKGFVGEVLGVSMDEAFRLLRAYSRAHGEHLTDVARRLMRDRYTRPELIRALKELVRSHR